MNKNFAHLSTCSFSVCLIILYKHEITLKIIIPQESIYVHIFIFTHVRVIGYEQQQTVVAPTWATLSTLTARSCSSSQWQNCFHLLWKEECSKQANIQATFTRWVIYSASFWAIFSGLFKSTHCSLMQQEAGGTEQARCCHAVALHHSAISFIDFLFDGIIWSLYRSQMKWSSVLLAQLSEQGPLSNTVNCISKRINDTFAVTISFFWCHLISSVKWLHQ